MPTVYIVMYNNTFTGIEGFIVRCYYTATEARSYCESANLVSETIEHWYVRTSWKSIEAFRVKEVK